MLNFKTKMEIMMKYFNYICTNNDIKLDICSDILIEDMYLLKYIYN